jgi:hypothetical protein
LRRRRRRIDSSRGLDWPIHSGQSGLTKFYSDRSWKISSVNGKQVAVAAWRTFTLANIAESPGDLFMPPFATALPKGPRFHLDAIDVEVGNVYVPGP